jgi:glutamate racemase
MGRKVRLIDSAEETAREVEELLDRSRLRRRGRGGGRRFYASDGPTRFLALAKRFLGVAVDRVTIWRFD